MQLDWHDLKTNGCPALLRALKQIEIALAQQDADIAELQCLVSEDHHGRPDPAGRTQKPQLLPRQRQIVAELGHGWQIVRQPNANPEATTMAAARQTDYWLTNPPSLGLRTPPPRTANDGAAPNPRRPLRRLLRPDDAAERP